MKIIQISPFEESVPPKKYGGTELVVYNLTQELVRKGHEVHLIASGDSRSDAKLLPVFPKSLRRYPSTQDMRARDALKYMGIGKVLELLKNTGADIIHNHIGWRLLPFAAFFGAPCVTTLHGPLDPDYQKLVYGAYASSNYVSISNSQRVPLKKLNYAGTVYNGIDIKKFKYSDKGGDYFAFLGRMSPEKGPVQAIKLAKKAGIKLVMAAKVDAVDNSYFTKEVKPLIDGKQISFIGEVGHNDKVKLLRNARALLAPIQWREPFGLFFIEAMACGTPVITNKLGSAPEIIKNGETGFVADNEAQLLSAVRGISNISRADCRKRVERFFTSEKMTEGYEEIYRKLILKKTI